MTVTRERHGVGLARAALSIIFGASVLAPSAQAQAIEPQNPEVQVETSPTAEPIEVDISRMSLADGFLRNTRQPIGLSVGMFHTYGVDSVQGSSFRNQFHLTSLRPALFAHFGRRNAQLRLTYSPAFERYQVDRENDTVSHAASAEFSRRLSRRVTLRATNIFRSSFNDHNFLPNATIASPLSIYQSGLSQEVYVDRQKQTWNDTDVGLSYELSRKSSVGMSARYNFVRYELLDGNSHGVSVAIRGDYRINRWLTFDSSFSTYLNTIDENYRTSSIQRLQFAGFRYRLGKLFSLFSSVGVEHYRYLGDNRTDLSFQGGLSANSDSFQVFYNRGYVSAFGGGTVGGGTVMDGHIVNAVFVQRLTRRISASVSSVFAKGTGTRDATKLETISGGASMQFSIASNALLTTSYYYVSQNAVNFPDIKRYSVTAGIEYFLPSLGRR